MQVHITAHLDGVEIVSRRLDAVAARLRDARPAWPVVLATFQAITRQAFASEGATTAAGTWPELAPSTIKERERLGYGPRPILRRSGVLEESLTGHTGDTILVEEATYFGIGTAVPYVVFHQSLAPRSKLPRRAVVSLTTDQKHELLLPLRQWFTGYMPTGRKQ
jgi:phage gpG-like protein